MAELAREHFDRSDRLASPLGARPAVVMNSPPPKLDSLDASDWRGSLGRVIETEILPRLLLAHRGGGLRDSGVANERSGELDLVEFVDLLIAPQADRARECLEKSGRDRSPEGVLLDVLAPAARRLGQLWETDHCDFVDVTVGLRRLHDAIRYLIPDFDDVDHEVEPTGRALFLPAPGETHVFGLMAVDRFFRRARWRTHMTDAAAHLDQLRREWFDIVGFSLSCERHVAALADAIRKARSASLNKSILVLVGGQIFADQPELCGRIGADATANDAPSAVQLADALVQRRAGL
jgi:methanogenic corrinoid protein MtbC1